MRRNICLYAGQRRRFRIYITSAAYELIPVTVLSSQQGLNPI